MEEHGAVFCSGCFGVVAFSLAELYDAVHAVRTPPVNLCTAVIDLANRDSRYFRFCRRHGELVPVSMVIIGGDVLLGIDSFEEEVVSLSRGKAGKRYASALRGCLLLNGLYVCCTSGNVVEYCDEGDFVCFPGDNCGGIRCRNAHDIAEERPFVVWRERFCKALCRHQKLDREVNAGFCSGIVFPVFK